jgi:hypothetical protein
MQAADQRLPDLRLRGPGSWRRSPHKPLLAAVRPKQLARAHPFRRARRLHLYAHEQADLLGFDFQHLLNCVTGNKP